MSHARTHTHTQYNVQCRHTDGYRTGNIYLLCVDTNVSKMFYMQLFLWGVVLLDAPPSSSPNSHEPTALSATRFPTARRVSYAAFPCFPPCVAGCVSAATRQVRQPAWSVRSTFAYFFFQCAADHRTRSGVFVHSPRSRVPTLSNPLDHRNGVRRRRLIGVM